MRILSIALISKHNTPLWVKNYSHSRNADAELKWHTVAHCSLDYFEEREAAGFKSQDGYVGLLYTLEDYAVYGFQTNTRVKIVLVLELTDVTIRDHDVKTIFRAIHNTYINYVSNPFSPAINENSKAIPPYIKSKTFDQRIDAMATPAG